MFQSPLSHAVFPHMPSLAIKGLFLLKTTCWNGCRSHPTTSGVSAQINNRFLQWCCNHSHAPKANFFPWVISHSRWHSFTLYCKKNFAEKYISRVILEKLQLTAVKQLTCRCSHPHTFGPNCWHALTPLFLPTTHRQFIYIPRVLLRKGYSL